MIAASTVVICGLMYLNTYAVDHIVVSDTRAYMALVMGATIAVHILGCMLKMHESRKASIGSLAGSMIVFAGALWLVRRQRHVKEPSWIKAAITHLPGNADELLPRNGRRVHRAEYVRLMLNRAEIGQTSANVMLRGSDLHGLPCGVGAAARVRPPRTPAAAR